MVIVLTRGSDSSSFSDQHSYRQQTLFYSVSNYSQASLSLQATAKALCCCFCCSSPIQ
jgi:hypothetical protein